MNTRDLRERYISFFESKGHARHASAPLIPLDVTGKLDPTLLFTSAGMVQFKPYYLGIAEPPSRRLVSCQKCLRTTDIEEVGDASHLTFFEMLGNFSFGDYFKREAIEWAWEFLTSPKGLGLPPERLCVTVFEEDDEAYEIWRHILGNEGKIHRLGEDKNYWPAGALSAGPPGPCGPCTEIFYRVASEGELSGDFRQDEARGKWLEIWNLVFIQYEWKGRLKSPDRPMLGYIKEDLVPLAKPGVDTGMGLERTAQTLAGLPSVYEVDTFQPLVKAIATRARYSFGSDEVKDKAVRIIADHLRAASFCIADGVLPSNTGRGYVLRRLLRRALLKGVRVLSFRDAFLKDLFSSVQESFGEVYPELIERADLCRTVLEEEEHAFRRTLERGWEILMEMIRQQGSGRNVLSGKDAFWLYDTMGFPLELTKEVAEEHGFTVDEEGYLQELEAHRELSQRSSAEGLGTRRWSARAMATTRILEPRWNRQTRFRGYETTEAEGRIVGISLEDREGKFTGRFWVALDETPFYAEAGGQVGDQGWLEGEGLRWFVLDAQREGEAIWHLCEGNGGGASVGEDSFRSMVGREAKELEEPMKRLLGAGVCARVDSARRRHIMRNHTGTHLLHSALRRVLGSHVTQSGSLVAPDRLRFDFTHPRALTESELEEIEGLVNEKILESLPVLVHWDVPLEEARRRGAMMLFGEKYGDRVRMIEVPGFSLELCGGTHVSNTSEIGLFKITHESSSAAGVRRIEAVTGKFAYDFVRQIEGTLELVARRLKTEPSEVLRAVGNLQSALDEMKRRYEELLSSSVAGAPEVSSIPVGEVRLYKHVLEKGGVEAAKTLVDRLIEKDPKGVALVVAALDEGGAMVGKAGPQALGAGAHAGSLVSELARSAGGKGGGSKVFAQGGAKDYSALVESLSRAEVLLAGQIGVSHP